MVRTSFKLKWVLVVLIPCFAGCRGSDLETEVGDFRSVQSSFIGLSFRLAPILSNGAITSIEQLTREYDRRYPKPTPLFMTRDTFPAVTDGYDLPMREYFWIQNWSTNDQPMTPMFWSYFRIPKDVVLYLAIDGTENCVPSNGFFAIVAPLSNRVEKATLKKFEQIQVDTTKMR